MTQYTAEQIWELRFNAALDRFSDDENEMEIPAFEEKPVSLLLRYLEEKRFEMCKQHYQGMEDYMDIPDMQVWLKLKNEIIHFPKTTLKSPFEYYEIEEEEDDEFRYKCFKDKWLSSRRRSF
jgi:hypothetical protein